MKEVLTLATTKTKERASRRHARCMGRSSLDSWFFAMSRHSNWSGILNVRPILVHQNVHHWQLVLHHPKTKSTGLCLLTRFMSVRYMVCERLTDAVRWYLTSWFSESNFTTHRKYFPAPSRNTLKCCTWSPNLQEMSVTVCRVFGDHSSNFISRNTVPEWNRETEPTHLVFHFGSSQKHHRSVVLFFNFQVGQHEEKLWLTRFFWQQADKVIRQLKLN